MRVCGAENQRLFVLLGVDVLDQLGQDHTIEVLDDDPAIEGFHLEVDFVGQLFLPERRVALRRAFKHEHLLAGLVVDAVLGQPRQDAYRRIVIDEEAVHDGLAIGVAEHGRAEDFGRVQRRSSGEADLHGVEVIEDATVLGDVVVFVAEQQFAVRELAVEQVAAVALVDDDAVVLIDRRDFWIVALERSDDALHHRLDGRDVEAGFAFGFEVGELLYVVNVRERLQILEA